MECVQRDMRRKLNFMCLINESKWNRLTGTERVIDLSRKNSRLEVVDVKIKDPDNPARLNRAKMIKFSVC